MEELKGKLCRFVFFDGDEVRSMKGIFLSQSETLTEFKTLQGAYILGNKQIIKIVPILNSSKNGTEGEENGL